MLSKPSLSLSAKEDVSLPEPLERHRTTIGTALRAALLRDSLGVYDMLRYHMGWVDAQGEPCVATQGKALRPALCLLACEATGGAPHQALPLAVAMEFIHNFSLIHDDIQDRDTERHHRPTLWYVWGEPQALAAGNALRTLADLALTELASHGVDCGKTLRASALLTEAYLEMIEGQYLDLSYEACLDISMSDYMAMISRKTGALIRCAIQLGALMGTDDEEIIEVFRVFGDALGRAFQIRDDFLGIWGDPNSIGKPVGADIRRKKKSLPLVYALAQARGSGRARLLRTYNKATLDDGDVALVMEIMERAGAREYTQRLAEEECANSLQALEQAELAPWARQELQQVTEFLLTRQH